MVETKRERPTIRHTFYMIMFVAGCKMVARAQARLEARNHD